jgi:tripeptide aminopeptidase
MTSVVERFIRYAKIDTTSDPQSKTIPSTLKQLDLAHLLVMELKALGLSEVSLHEQGHVTASLAGNTPGPAPVIGLLAHMDTAPNTPGNDVNPRFVENYDGRPIILDQEKGIHLSPMDFPELNQYIGQTLITTDGLTLLGADDKAGLAEIMTSLEYLIEHPEINRCPLRIGFTVDEETGHGVDHFDVKAFAANFAFTIDGGEIGTLEYENFNAAQVRLTIHGRDVHPGSAKNKMVNALLIAMELNAMLPPAERPEYTDGVEGFYHLNRLDGSVEEAVMDYILRDHDFQKFLAKKSLFQKAVDYLNERYGAGTVVCVMEDQYYNMKEKILPVRHLVETAEKAMRSVGVKPVITPIRGGTDGARLSYSGLPTPNLFTGGHNYHSRYEYIPVQSMEKAVETIVKIVELYAAMNV